MNPQRPHSLNDEINAIPISFLLKKFFSSIVRYLVIIVLIALAIFFSKGIILVQEGEMAILIKKTGMDLTNYDAQRDEYRYLLSCPTIAPTPDYKGIHLDTLPEGWHFFNPYTWDYVIVKQTKISAGEVGVKVRLFGKPLDTTKYQVLAEEGQMGIMRDVLMPGQHLVNPYAYQVIRAPAYVVPQGHRGVVTNLAAPLPTNKTFCMGDLKDAASLVLQLVKGDTPAAKYVFAQLTPQIQEMLRQYNPSLPPTKVFKKAFVNELNRIISRPQLLYKADAYPAANLQPDVKLVLQKQMQGEELLQVNRWLLADLFPNELERSSFLVNEDERGVSDETLHPSTYYFNPFEKQVTPVDIRSHRFDLTGPHQVLFPSFDGFMITMEGNIEWHIDTERVAEVYVKYQDDRDMIACVEEKIILPNARAFIRIEGSKYMARDYISGLTREQFQNTFFENLSISCKHEGIIIRAARVTKCMPPDEICDPIQAREIAIRDREKYDQEMEREKEQIKLQMEATRKDFEIRKTRAQTTVEVNKTNAAREKEVAIIGMTRKVEVARKRLEAARNEAQAIIMTARAEADVVRMQNKAEASGIAEARAAFKTGANYANFLLLKKVSASLEYILANTDSPFLNVFRDMGQMSPKPKVEMPQQPKPEIPQQESSKKGE